MCVFRDIYKGDKGVEPGRLDTDFDVAIEDLDCSSSEESGELLHSSCWTAFPRATIAWDVLRTGLPFLPLPSFEGLPGAPFGSRSLTFLGTRNEQFSQASLSESKLPLNRLQKSVSLE